MLELAKNWIPRKKVACRNRPYCDEELRELIKVRDELRKEPAKIEEWREKTEELKERLKEKIRVFWRKFLEKMQKGDERKAWKTIKSLDTGNKREAPNEILIVEGREARTDLQKARAFMDQYATVTRIRKGGQ